ncbi:NAD(P)H-hydrate dehydratase [Xenorhabdus sp. PB30.3]|uniref:NAD(P)H-hydrate dehydratase n=1 Tax=Xenorhabdus sp. PB30.3 TaxID=2788941 RepID=UPI001E607B37|nr:NAD(P)H-hydrate dehydratase [Xenorhabdus sp. PB30.3]MCC8381825.1 NAD(P)H-hydrate dehydratase [Xenorhabdus sp. PB30.3]
MITQDEKKQVSGWFPTLILPRPEDSHKGTFGTLNIIGGAETMSGACVLAGTAALKSGCGKVIIGFNQESLAVQLIDTVPELILNKASQLFEGELPSAWVIGCGLGTSTEAVSFIQKMIKHIHQGEKVLIDADGLNILAKFTGEIELSDKTVITPHVKEASRLLQTDSQSIQSDRLGSAQALSTRYGCWVVLKGHRTVIAAPDGRTWVNETGNSGLATAGSGDVLSGIIGSLLAQSIPFEEAVRAGVWLHGKAADMLVADGIGPIGLTAHEIIDYVRKIRNQITNHDI